MKSDILNETKKYVLMARVGKIMMRDGLPVFIISVLSPFDFEGPVIEIVTSSLVAVGGILKLISSKGIKDIEIDIESEECDEVKTQVKRLINKSRK